MHLKKSFLTILILFLIPLPVFCRQPILPKNSEAFFKSLSSSQKVTYLSYLILSGRENEAFEKIRNLKNLRLDEKFKNRFQFIQGYLDLLYGKPTEAFGIFENLSGKYPEIESILPYWIARAARLKGDPEKAIEILEKECQGPCQIAVTKTSETVFIKKRGFRKRARKITFTKTTITKQSYRMVREYASALCESGETLKAEEIFNRLIKQDSESSTQELTQLDLIQCKMKQNKIEEVYKELRHSYVQAKGRTSKNLFEGILENLHQAKSTIPNKFILEDRIARIATLKYLDRWVEAAKEYKEILNELKPSSSMILEIAETFFKARFYKEAAEQYEIYLGSGLDVEEKKSVQEKLAAAYARSNQFDKAIQTLKNLEGDSDPHKNYKIAFLLVDGGRYEEAISYLQTFSDRFPRSKQKETNWLKAWSLYRLKKFNEAAEEFLKIEQTYPKSAEAKKAEIWEKRSREILSGRRASSDRKKNCPTLDPKREMMRIDFQVANSLLEDPTSKEFLSLGLWSDFFERYPLRGRDQNFQKRSESDWREGSNSLNSWIRFFASIEQIPPELVFAVIHQESRFNPFARSPAGAIGLMQIIPQTGFEIAESLHFDSYQGNDLANPLVNIRFGIHYLAYLQKRFQGNLVYTIASYNAGPEAVERWISQRSGYSCDEFIEEIPYSETRNYVEKIVQKFWD